MVNEAVADPKIIASLKSLISGFCILEMNPKKPLAELGQNVFQSKDRLLHNKKLMLENIIRYTKET